MFHIDVNKLRQVIIVRDKFFGRALITLPFIERDDIDTFATDASAVYYNQDFADTLTQDECIFVILHELLHCLYNHIPRKGKRDAMRFNQACDYSINYLLVQAGYKMPDGGLYDAAYAGMSPEEIYSKLPTGDDMRPGNSFDQPLLENNQPDIEESWRTKAIQSKKMSKKAGNMTAAMAEIIDGLSPKVDPVDWKAVLSDWVTDRSNDNYTWSRPNKRLISQGMYLPSLDICTVRHVAFLIDTSGSMDESALQRATVLLQSLLDSGTVTDITVIQTDTEVHSNIDYSTGDTIPNEYTGRGGTNFTEAMALASELDIAGIIAFTDMEISPQRCGIDPDMPVIWAITGTENTYQRYKNTPNFGEVFHVTD